MGAFACRDACGALKLASAGLARSERRVRFFNEMLKKVESSTGRAAAGRSEEDERRRRLAAALRENLGRRKAQDRERRAPQDGPPADEGRDGATAEGHSTKAGDGPAKAGGDADR